MQGTFTEEVIRARTAFAVEPVRTQSAGEAFAAVLRHAGASRPRRDAVDARIVQYRCSGSDNQQWFLLPFGDGTYTIVARHSGKCLDVNGASSADGAPVQQWACSGGENQRWIVESDAGVTRLRSKRSNQCLDVPAGSRADDVRLQQYTCHAGGNQRFSLTGG